MPTSRFLFIPVSSPDGMGEYARSLILATQIQKLIPHAQISFILNKQAPYSATCPFESYFIDSSPTKAGALVNKLISEFQPDVVVFDASGRASQFKHAKKCGAKVIFISQHQKKRARGMKLNRARAIDYHFVVQPEFVMPALSTFEKMKVALGLVAQPINVGPVFLPVALDKPTPLAVQQDEFVLLSAGSGGHTLENGQYATDIYLELAQLIAKNTKLKPVIILGNNYPNSQIEIAGVTVIPSLNNQDFINLLAQAHFVILSGGDTLLQAIALKKLIVSSPVSKDQPDRIQQCGQQGLIQSSATNADALLQSLEKLISKNDKIKQQLNRLNCENGINIILDKILDKGKVS